jgi:hypothetical protein
MKVLMKFHDLKNLELATRVAGVNVILTTTNWLKNIVFWIKAVVRTLNIAKSSYITSRLIIDKYRCFQISIG